MNTYITISSHYKYAALRAGIVLQHLDGREVYFQPGDDESIIRYTIDALDECDDDDTRDTLADIALSEYFA